MSKFWYFLVLVLLVLGVWLFIKGCPPSNDDDTAGIAPPPPYAGTIGFDSIKVEGDLIMKILSPEADTFPGFRVYNARMPQATTNSPGLILVATDKDSAEIDSDGTMKYVFINPDGIFKSGLSRNEARRAVLEVARDTNYLRLITDFSYDSLRSHWRDNIPVTINFIPAKYQRDGKDYSSANIMYLSSSSEEGDEINSISSAPCPPHCPSIHKLLYDWEMELLSDEEDDEYTDK